MWQLFLCHSTALVRCIYMYVQLQLHVCAIARTCICNQLDCISRVKLLVKWRIFITFVERDVLTRIAANHKKICILATYFCQTCVYKGGKNNYGRPEKASRLYREVQSGGFLLRPVTALSLFFRGERLLCPNKVVSLQAKRN